MTALPSVVQASPSSHVGVGPPTPCPWIYESLHHHHTAQQLAAQVADLMTPAELASFVVLQTHSGIENFNVGVPRLCIPTLTLVDGPSGVSANATGVTQFPVNSQWRRVSIPRPRVKSVMRWPGGAVQGI